MLQDVMKSAIVVLFCAAGKHRSGCGRGGNSSRPRRAGRPDRERARYNSLKYAFDENGGVISVVFRVDQAIGEAKLSVSDNGRGMGPPREGRFRVAAGRKPCGATWRTADHARGAKRHNDDTVVSLFGLRARRVLLRERSCRRYPIGLGTKPRSYS